MRERIIANIEQITADQPFDKNSRWGISFRAGTIMYKWLMDVPYKELDDENLLKFYDVVKQRYFKWM